MRISPFTPLLAVIISASLLYHHTEALGTDSASHGLLNDGRVVRRYGNFGSDSLFNKRYSVRSRGFQERAEEPKDGADPAKGAKGAKGDNEPKDSKDPKPKEKDEPKKEKAKQPPAPANDPANDPTDTDPTSANQEQAPAPGNAAPVGAPAAVPTGDMSMSAMVGLVSIGGVFALVAGLFAFSKRRKNKEMTKNIMTTSAKAWEHQNSTFEKMEEEDTSPIGSYTVIATYTPNLSDELDIQPGDKVTILVEFDDGWVQGINETRGGTKGVFPRHCVDMDRVTPSINNKRSSSIGGYTSERYTEVDLN